MTTVIGETVQKAIEGITAEQEVRHKAQQVKLQECIDKTDRTMQCDKRDQHNNQSLTAQQRQQQSDDDLNNNITL